MVFSSTIFLFFFLPIVLILYYLVPSKFKNIILLFSSLVFYAWGEPIYIILMCISSFVDYLNGRLLAKNNNEKTRKRFLTIAIFINLSLLGFFKYSDFLIRICNSIFNTSIPLLNLGLPIGISFYTFQTMSYSIDVYRRSVDVETNYFRYLTYVSLFPQLVAGPIVRYSTIANELKDRKIIFDNIVEGFLRFLRGLFKKILIANNIGIMYETILASDLNQLSVLTLWLGIICYAVQIYFDFSGYSDMAIGLGLMMGFKFLENFNYPLIADSITNFWRRWHMSLSSWFRDYVYIPLGGNRVNAFKRIRNILIVWFLTGFWHGAAWNFILWGIYFGVILIFEKKFLLKFLNKTRIVKYLYTLVIVIISFLIFSSDSLDVIGNELKNMFFINNIPFTGLQTTYYLKNNFLLLIISIIGATPLISYLVKKIKKSKFKIVIDIIEPIVYLTLLILCTAFLIDESFNPFLYFRF